MNGFRLEPFFHRRYLPSTVHRLLYNKAYPSITFKFMPRYAISFVTAKPSLLHHLVEMDSRDSALRAFFNEHAASQGYTADSEGFAYFLEDFNNPEEPMGSILEV
jgi:hypothetical protein